MNLIPICNAKYSSGQILTDHVLNTKIRNALQIYVSEERIQYYKHEGHTSV
jgi:hypothetical protein